MQKNTTYNMKHLKLFENQGDRFCIVVYEDLSDANNNTQVLFDDQGAENYFLDMINGHNKNEHQEEFTDEDLLLTVSDAEAWI